MSATDKAALLAAINASVSAPKNQIKTNIHKNVKYLAEEHGVNTRVAHDLVSNASKANEVAEIKDFESKVEQDYNHKNTYLDKANLGSQHE